jgi:predicted GTPase
MVGGTKKMAPTVQFTKDESTDKITVATADSGVPWTSLQIRSDKNVKIWINGEVTVAAGVDLTANTLTLVTAAMISGGAAPYNIAAADSIDIEGGTTAVPAAQTDVTITMVHADTGTVLQTVLFSTVALIAT